MFISIPVTHYLLFSPLLPAAVFAVIAVVALVLTIKLSVVLISSGKENRQQMTKTKIKAVVSALCVPLMAAAAICSWDAFPSDPISWDYNIPDLTGLPYEECKIAYTSFIDISASDMVYSSEYPEGTIISQSLESGTYQMPQPYYVFSMQCVVSKGSENEDAG